MVAHSETDALSAAQATPQADIPRSGAEQLIVFGLRADPEPQYIFAVHLCESAVTQADSGRVDVVLMVYLLEIKAGMSGLRRNNLFDRFA